MNHVLRRLAFGTSLTLAASLGAAGPATAAFRPGPQHAHADFVQRQGDHLSLAGAPFRFSGVNEYWLGLDENVGGVNPTDPPAVGYPSFFRIRDGLTTAKDLGSTVVRAHTVGVSTGNPLSLEPSLGVFNPSAFASMDYAVAEAGRLGLRLVVPLTDNWQYYHGGRYDFLRWLGLSTANDGALFYTDPRARAAYQQYIHVLLTHVNPYTGLAYDRDPTIMAWELGNEMNGMTQDWVESNAEYVKSLAPRQLVAAGRQSGVDPAVLASPAVDISDSHYYPPTVAGISADAAKATAAGKVYLAGEYGSPQASTDLLSQVAADPDVTGALVWSLFPHDDHYGYVQHDDGFTLHYPGDTPAMVAENQALQQFAAMMSGRPTQTVYGDAPLITAVTKVYGINQLEWRGTAGAAGYQVQRQTAGRPWTTVTTHPVTDNDTPWLDLSTPAGALSYRVRALDASGAVVATSAPVRVGAGQDAVVDPLEDWFVASDHSAGLLRTPAGHGVLVQPAHGRTGSITYQHKDLASARIEVQSHCLPAVKVEASADGTSGWHPVPVLPEYEGSGHWSLLALHLDGADGLRVVWTGTGCPAAVSQVALTAASASTAASAPGAFDVTAPASGATGVSTQARIAWAPAGEAAYYSLTVSSHADFSAPIVDLTGLRGTSYTPTTPWPASTLLYVRVTATNGAGTTTAGASSFATRAATPGVLIDDFDSYASDAELAAAYPRNAGGDVITPTLAPPGEDSGHSMLLTYALGANGYAGVIHTFAAAQDWRGTAGLRLWVKPGGDGQQLTVQFVAGGAYWETTITLSGTDPRVVEIPFTDFAPPSWANQSAVLDLSSATQLSLYPGGTVTNGTIQIDSISAYPAS